MNSPSRLQKNIQEIKGIKALVQRLWKHPEALIGQQHMMRQGLGVMAWGLMTGVAMAKSGLSIGSALLMALLVYAGSAQLAVLPLLMAGAPVWVIWITGFCVNLRFVVFSLHLRAYLMHVPRIQRIFLGYLSGDLTYLLFTRHFSHPSSVPEKQEAQAAYLLRSSLTNWFCWMLPSLLGIVLAQWIPTHWGLGFAGLLCLVGLLCSLASTQLRLLAAVVSALVAVIVYALPFRLNIAASIIVAMTLCLALERLPFYRQN